jgi:hypothetical protein
MPKRDTGENSDENPEGKIGEDFLAQISFHEEITT